MFEECMSNPLVNSNNCLETAIQLVISETADLIRETSELLYIEHHSKNGQIIDACNATLCSRLLKISHWLLNVEAYLNGSCASLPANTVTDIRLAPLFSHANNILPEASKSLLLKTDRLSGRIAHLNVLFDQYFTDAHAGSLNEHLIAQCSLLSRFVYTP